VAMAGANKQWNCVISSTGFVPEFESSYALNYSWNASDLR